MEQTHAHKGLKLVGIASAVPVAYYLGHLTVFGIAALFDKVTRTKTLAEMPAEVPAASVEAPNGWAAIQRPSCGRRRPKCIQ